MVRTDRIVLGFVAVTVAALFVAAFVVQYSENQKAKQAVPASAGPQPTQVRPAKNNGRLSRLPPRPRRAKVCDAVQVRQMLLREPWHMVDAGHVILNVDTESFPCECCNESACCGFAGQSLNATPYMDDPELAEMIRPECFEPPYSDWYGVSQDFPWDAALNCWHGPLVGESGVPIDGEVWLRCIDGVWERGGTLNHESYPPNWFPINESDLVPGESLDCDSFAVGFGIGSVCMGTTFWVTP